MPRVPEPRWPVALALLAAAGMHFVLPRSLVMGPPWMVLGSVALLIAVAWYARTRQSWTWNERLDFMFGGHLDIAYYNTEQRVIRGEQVPSRAWSD